MKKIYFAIFMFCVLVTNAQNNPPTIESQPSLITLNSIPQSLDVNDLNIATNDPDGDNVTLSSSVSQFDCNNVSLVGNGSRYGMTFPSDAEAVGNLQSFKSPNNGFMTQFTLEFVSYYSYPTEATFEVYQNNHPDPNQATGLELIKTIVFDIPTYNTVAERTAILEKPLFLEANRNYLIRNKDLYPIRMKHNSPYMGGTSIIQQSVGVIVYDNAIYDNGALNVNDYDWKFSIIQHSIDGISPIQIPVNASDGTSQTNSNVDVYHISSIQPNIITQDITVNLDANGLVSITPEQVDNGSYATCYSALTLSLNKTDFDCTSIGQQTLTLTGVDTYGNTASANAIVTIRDFKPIEFLNINDITTGTSIDSKQINYNMFVKTGSCNSSILNINNFPETPAGFTKIGVFNGHTYFISNSTDTYANFINTIASINGAYPVSISSAAENSFIADYLDDNGLLRALIGLNDIQTEGDFVWENGEDVTYTNWYPGQPTNSGAGQDIGEIYNHGGWVDTESVNNNRPIIIEFSYAVEQTAGLPSGSNFPLGTTVNSFEAFDEEGNTSSISFSVNITDSGDPVVSCPDSIELVTTGTSETVSYALPTFTENSLSGSFSIFDAQEISGFTKIGTHNNHTYFISDVADNYTNFMSNLNSISAAYPITINTEAENTFIANYLQSNSVPSVLLGLTDVINEGDFVWENAETLTYTNWNAGEPNDFGTGEDYVQMFPNGIWNDIANNSLQIIIEVPFTTGQTAGLASGSDFPLGTTTNTYVVTDSNGNQGSCSFDITITDTDIDYVRFEEVSGTLFDGTIQSSIAFADVDGDADQEILITGANNNPERISKLYINDGNGGFVEKTNVPFTSVTVGNIAFADIDNDGDQDLLITGNSTSGAIAKLYENDGDGNYTEVIGTPFAGVQYSSVSFADINGDNFLDVLITGENNNQPFTRLYENDAAGNFIEVNGLPNLRRASHDFADIDGDGDQDVLISGRNIYNQSFTILFSNDGNGNYSPVNTNFFSGWNGSVKFADFDGDNDFDLVISGTNQNFFSATIFYKNDGNGNFSFFQTLNEILQKDTHFADVDGDGDLDILTTNFNNTTSTFVKLYVYDGSGQFIEIPNLPFEGVRTGAIGFFDMDNDGDQDVLITGRNSSNLRISKIYRNISNRVSWLGNVNSDWTDNNNWEDAVLPSSTQEAFIPSSSTNQPVVSQNETAEVLALSLENNSTLDVSGVLKTHLKIHNDGQITFKSDATNTGQFDTYTGMYSGTGNVTVEQFIPSGDNNKRAFRFLASPVTTSNSIRMNWQEGASSNTDNPNPGFGTHITGSTNDGTNGFDGTNSGSPSLLVFNNTTQSWEPISNTDVNTLEAGKAYNLFVRGDRSIDLSSSSQTPNNTTLRATGSLVSGQVDFTPELATGNAEWSLLGNPYQSIVEFGDLNFSGNINSNIIYVWKPNYATSGSYEAIDNATPADQMIQPGQSFFVQNSAVVTTPPGLEFTESSKNTSGMITDVFDNGNIGIVDLSMYNNDIKVDVLKLRFEAGADNGIDDFDAGKLGNPTENLASVNGNTLLSIERRDLPKPSEILPLFINQYQDSQYEFRLNTLNLNDNFEIYIVDNYLNTSTLIDFNQVYSFNVDSNIPESIASDRFYLVFDNTTLSVNDNTFGEGFSLYPNPTTDAIFIKGITTQAEITVYDVLGKKVLQTQIQNAEEAIDLHQLEAGVYLVKVEGENYHFTQKMIKK